MTSWYDALAQICVRDSVDEVYVNGIQSLGIFGGGRHRVEPSPFTDRQTMILALQDFALDQGLRLDPLSPAVGGFDQSRSLRWHCVLPPLAPQGPLFSLRRHRFGDIDWPQFKVADEVVAAVEHLFVTKSPMLLCGETGSGKTTLLAELLRRHANDDRVLILEELEELPLWGPLWARLLCRKEGASGRGALDLASLFNESLRLRPDWLVFGELRGLEMATFVQALSSGQQGVVATVHAASSADVKRRLSAFCPSGNEGLSFWCLFLKRGLQPCVEALEHLIL